MKVSELALTLEKLEKTSSRIEITNILALLFKKSETKEVDKICYLILGTLAPNFEGVVLNLAEKMMLKVLSQGSGISAEEVKNLYKKSGDIGDAAYQLSRGKDGLLSVSEVYSILLSIAKDAGEGSQERKITVMTDLIKRLDPLSAKYISRIPVGKLRLGFSEKTIIDALAGREKKEKKQIEEAFNIRPDIGYIAKLTKEGKLKSAQPVIGVPVMPMLAQRLNSPSEMIEKMGEVAVEPKFDGLRIFIHFRRKDGLIKIFTRNMNSIDEIVFPELKEIGKSVSADEIILDTEAVGIDSKREVFLDFQKTIQRRRKHQVEKAKGEIPLQFQVFDVLLCNGKSYIDKPYLQRRREIEKVVINGKLLRVDESTITKNPEVIKKLHQKYLAMGLEGVVVKRAHGNYVSGRTGWNWVKMKEEEGRRGKLSDTIDCIIMGYSLGKGKRAGFGVGQFLAGIADDGQFKTLTKVGTGLTDIQFKELNNQLKDVVVEKMPKEYLVHKDLIPDFWVLPKVVVELAADEITASPKHTAGYALRFPRLIKFRDDKSARDITDTTELKEILRK